MARQHIDIGTVANDNTGDPLRDAMDKSNDNFIELYTGWTLAGSWTFSTNVTEVDFPNLGGYSEILIFARGITMSSSGTRNFRVSSDNGSSFYSASGDYQTLSNAGVETAGTSLAGHGTATTAARSFTASIYSFNAARTKPVLTPTISTVAGVITQAVALNAVRVFPTAGSFTAGSIQILGRI